MNRLLLCILLAVLLPCAAGGQKVHTAEECRQTFVEYMNTKARLMGLTHTRFADPSGYKIGKSAITPEDAVNLILQADSRRAISQTWGKPVYHMHVKGSHARTDTITWGRRNAFTTFYKLLGGKTGTLAGCHNAVFICRAPGGNRFVAAIINSSWDQRWRDAKKLIDIARRRCMNPEADVSDIKLKATGAYVALYPSHPQATARPLESLYSREPSTEHVPASVTKVMTAICLLDWVTDLDAYFEISGGDMMPGSGPKFHVGDSITFRDALHAMFLPSSNTAAVAIARIVGKKILEAQK